MVEFEDQVFAWFSSAESEERQRLLRRIVRALPIEDLKIVKSAASRAKNARKREADLAAKAKQGKTAGIGEGPAAFWRRRILKKPLVTSK